MEADKNKFETEKEAEKTGQFVDIPHGVIYKMTKNKLIEDLQKRGHPKGRNRKTDLHIRLKQTLHAGFVVMLVTQQR